MKLMSIQSQIDQHGNYFLRVCPHTKSELMYRSFLAIKDQIKRFSLTGQFICHKIIGLSAINLRHDMIKVLTAYLLTILEVQSFLEQFLLPWQHTFMSTLAMTRESPAMALAGFFFFG